MARIYERDTKHYDRTVLDHLVETGQATFYAGPGIYVVKTDEGTFAVRPHQIVEIQIPIVVRRVSSPMDGYQAKERYDLEDLGPGGVVYDDAVELAEAWLRVSESSRDPLAIVRRILDDEDGSYAEGLREDIEELRPERPSRRYSSREDQELLQHFLG